MAGLIKIVASTVVVITVACATAVFLIPPIPQEQMARRQDEARRMMEGLSDAVWRYFYDHGEFPPGDGQGSAGLVRALRSGGRKGAPYMVFVPAMLTPRGDLRNPIFPEDGVVHYRCRTRPSEGTFVVEQNFDLWCRSAEGREMGINNWETMIPRP